MTIDIALKKAFATPREELAQALGMPLNTVDSYQHRFKKGGLSLSKKIEIIEGLGHKVEIIVLWKK